ncbi:allophycocyanin subunit alpha-B [Synechococcus sp. PCC 7336]|uniref:allophycocyanin subunit alpha-B n=1 Tax=Synechococcus sp. PCC 7336 TaxID=195250 RepID=UPI00034830DC|nr:allophycocyanin subunit alpha-B [Synechococcus sp. PCC 7336]
MSLINDLLEVADDELRYPTASELAAVRDYMGDGARRLRIAEVLSENRKKIVDESQRLLFAKRPEYRQTGGNASTQKRYNQCLRDYDWYLRLVTYGIIAGDKGPIESIGLVGVREMYNALNVPIPGMVDAMKFMKGVALELLNTEDIAVAEPYFDYIITAMSA